MYPKVTAAQKQEGMVLSHACKLFRMSMVRLTHLDIQTCLWHKNDNHWHEGGRKKMLPEKKHLQKAERPTAPMFRMAYYHTTHYFAVMWTVT